MLKTILIDVMLVASIGAFLDTVFIGEEERHRISAYLDSKNTNFSLNQRFSRFLKRTHAIIFGRFFHAKFLSFSFFISAASISVISFSCVISIQMYLFPDHTLERLKIDLVQIYLFAVFILFNICFDYFTIIQTKIFIEASIGAKDMFRSIIFILADIIVTVNTFIFGYAFFLLILALWFVWSPKTILFVFESGRVSFNPIVESVSSVPFDDPFKSILEINRIAKYEGSFSAILIPNDNEQAAEHMTVSYRSNFEPSDLKINFLLLKALGRLDQEENESYVILEKERINEIREISGMIFPSQPLQWNNIIGKFEADVEINRSRNIYDIYLSSLSTVDELENYFPSSLEGNRGLLNLQDFILRVMHPRFMDLAVPEITILDGKPMMFCFDEDQPQVILVLDGCKKFIFVNGTMFSDRKNVSLIGRNTDGYFIPFNTIFITSILPTTVIYAAIVLLATSIILFSRVIRGMNRVKRFLLRAPMAVSGFVLGVIFSLIGLI